MEATKNLVQALVSGNADAIETSFNAAMAEKISARLDDMRVDVAKGMFTAPVVEESFDLSEEEMLAITSLTEEEIETLEEAENFKKALMSNKFSDFLESMNQVDFSNSALCLHKEFGHLCHKTDRHLARPECFQV